MKLRYKLLLSIPIQIALYLGMPEFIQKLPFGGFLWVPSWDAIATHRIFKDESTKKVVFLGASYFGERYCSGEILESGAVLDDACMLSEILNEKKSIYPETKDFQFYQVTMGGTISNVHLYFLLHLIELPKNSIKYLIYDGPRTFNLQLVEREYHAFHLELAKKIESLPIELKTERLLNFSKQLKTQIAADYANGVETPNQLHWHLLKKFLRNRRDWIYNFQSGLKTAMYPQSIRISLEKYSKQHLQQYGSIEEKEAPQIVPLSTEDYMGSEKSFEFLDLLEDLCKLKGIQLVLYYSPSRRYYSWEKKEPYHSKIHQPTIDRYKPKGVKFLDYRAMPFLIPRDTTDGIHPAVPTKIIIADRILSDLRLYETEKSR